MRQCLVGLPLFTCYISAMSGTPKFDQISFPGGYEITDIIVAVKLAGLRHFQNPSAGELEGAIVKRFLLELAERHPQSVPFSDPYRLRGQELFDGRRSLLNSHLGLSWFGLAYWVCGLVAVRSHLSIAEYDDLNTFLTPIRAALRELGVRVSGEKCLAEVDRFLPAEVTARNVSPPTTYQSSSSLCSPRERLACSCSFPERRWTRNFSGVAWRTGKSEACSRWSFA